MTDPNTFTHTDILAAREIIKRWMTPAFAKDIDAGLLDGFGLFMRAEAMLIQQRKDEEQEAPE